MAPSASMLFLSYHQLHRPTATEAGAPQRRDREAEAAAAGFRMSVRNVLSLAMLQRRPAVGTTTTTLHERVAGEETKPSSAAAAAADANNEELEHKFHEALRLSCWSS